VFHVYDAAPFALKVAEFPAQIAFVPEIETTGKILTETIITAAVSAAQPSAFFPFKVYEVVPTGEIEIPAAFDPLLQV
jgi:hypothetical protein